MDDDFTVEFNLYESDDADEPEEPEFLDKSALIVELRNIFGDSFNVAAEINALEGENYILFAAGFSAFDLFDYEEAAEALDSLTPSSPLACIIAGRSCAAADNPHKALTYFNRGIMIDQHNVELLLDKVDALVDLQRYDQAFRALDKQFEQSADNARIQHKIGELHYALNKYDAALESAEKALALDPFSIDARVLRACSYDCKDDYERAIADYNLLAEQLPTFAWVYHSRGDIHFRKGIMDSARADARRAYELDPDDADVIDLSARIDLADGNRAKAILAYERGIEIDPENQILRIHLARQLLEIQQYATVVDILRPIVDSEDECYLEAFVLSGFAHEFLGNPKEALRQYNHALERDPEYFEAFFHKDLCERDYENQRLEDEIKQLELAERSERM